MTWNDLKQHPPSPMQELEDLRLTAAQVRLWIKRDDLLTSAPNHPCNGNKWRKLKYNLLHAREAGHAQLLSFGGIHANHIAALAAAGRDLGLATVGIIRGEDRPSPTLDLARACGMRLHFLSRSAYRQKMEPAQLNLYQNLFGDFLLLPEGGSNSLAQKGCCELGEEITAQLLPLQTDYISLPCGTGGTLAGLTLGVGPATKIIGFSVLKGDFLQKEIQRMLAEASSHAFAQWQINTDFHFGGYARWDERLIVFMQDFYARHGIALDPIYGGKHFYGLFQLISEGYFPAGSTLVAIHTGGLQGIAAFNQRFGLALPT